MSSSTLDNNIASNLQSVQDRISSACDSCQRDVSSVRLVAVSKTKPLVLLQEAYDAGQRVFGENYVQELLEKAPQLPDDVSWHFIGALQSNKVNKLVEIPNLVVETVSSEKLAAKLNKAGTFCVFCQVNTSREDSKSGVEPSEAMSLCRYIIEQCPNLTLQGLMTIGAPGDESCFDTLVACRDEISAALGMELELSMGMSDDFEVAIAKGATNIRVGSTIFGARDYSKK
jgi:pyridoxal phosphate enzyme (YggS family)